MDDEYSGLPADFDINENIPTLNQQLKKVPLAMCFYHLLMRMESKKPSGTDVREYDCYSQDDVNYYVYVWLYVWRCDDDHIYVYVAIYKGVTMIIYWLTTHFDKVNQADPGLLNYWKNSRKEYTRSSCDR